MRLPTNRQTTDKQRTSRLHPIPTDKPTSAYIVGASVGVGCRDMESTHLPTRLFSTAGAQRDRIFNNHRKTNIMISGLKSLFQRRVSGSTVAPATPNAAPVPAGLVAMTPAEAAEHARKLDERKAAFHAKQAQQPTPRSTKTETTKVEAPKVSASIETPKPAPKPDPIAQASASESIAPKAAAGTRTIITQPTVATTSTVKPASGKVVMLGRFKLQSGQFSTVREQPGPARNHFRMIGEIAQAAAPFNSVYAPRTPVRTLFVSWSDADATLRKIVRTSGNPRLRQASDVRHWADNIGVLSLNHTLDERFTLDSIRSELKKGKWDACIIWDERECLESFSGSETRMSNGLTGIAEDTGTAIAIYRPL